MGFIVILNWFMSVRSMLNINGISYVFKIIPTSFWQMSLDGYMDLLPPNYLKFIWVEVASLWVEGRLLPPGKGDFYLWDKVVVL